MRLLTLAFRMDLRAVTGRRRQDLRARVLRGQQLLRLSEKPGKCRWSFGIGGGDVRWVAGDKMGSLFYSNLIADTWAFTEYTLGRTLLSIVLMISITFMRQARISDHVNGTLSLVRSQILAGRTSPLQGWIWDGKPICIVAYKNEPTNHCSTSSVSRFFLCARPRVSA
jgi:hypothetical protein